VATKSAVRTALCSISTIFWVTLLGTVTPLNSVSSLSASSRDLACAV